MALSIKASAVILATLAVYFQDLTILGNEALRTELISHMLVIPFLFAYLIYRKRKMLRAVVVSLETPALEKRAVPFSEIVGIMLYLLAFLLYWHGSYTFYPLEYHLISLPLFLAGIILILFNVQTLKAMAFPIAFLLFLTPPPTGLISTASTFLATAASEATYTILAGVGLPVELTSQYGSPALILQRPGSPSIPFIIGIATWGVYSLIGFTVFAAFATYIVRGKTWQRALIFAAGFPLIYALNIIRIIATVLIGYQFGIEAPTEAFHTLGGWVVVFFGTFVLLYVSDKIFKTRIFGKNPKRAQCTKCNQRLEAKQDFCASCGKLLRYMKIKISRRDLFKIILLLISVALIMTMQVPVFVLTEGPAEVNIFSRSGEQVSTNILPEIPGYTLRFAYRDTRFEETASRDAALVYTYDPENGSRTPISATIEIASSRSVLQGLEVSSVVLPERYVRSPKVIQLDLRDIQLLQNPPIIGRFFAFKQENEESVQVFLYWYVSALFSTNSTSEQKYVKISLIDFANSTEGVLNVEEKLLPFGQAIVNYWQPIKTWSLAALLIAQNQYILIIFVTILLAISLTVQVVSFREEKQLNLIMYNKLSQQEEKVIFQAVNRATFEGKSTQEAIATSYESIAHKTIDPKKLCEKLKDAERAGLLKKAIINENDQPLIVWKSQIAFSRSKPYMQRIRNLFRLDKVFKRFRYRDKDFVEKNV